MGPVPELAISGLALGPVAESEASTQRTPVRRRPNAFNAQAFAPQMQQHEGCEDSSVYGSRSPQKAAQGQQQRRSWYKPSKVPDRPPSGRDRSTCPHRWKHLKMAAEEACSGSMCPGHKLRVCQTLGENQEMSNLANVPEHEIYGQCGSKVGQRLLAEKQKMGNMAKVAQQATLAAKKERLLHESEQTLLTTSSLEWRPPPARPSSAPCRQSKNSVTAVPAPMTSSQPLRPQSAGNLRRSQPQSIGNLRSSQSAQQRPFSATLQRSAPLLQQSPNSAGTAPATLQALRQKQRPQSAGTVPASGSILRLGTNPAILERLWKHSELRTHSATEGFKENVRKWEEHLSQRTQALNSCPADLDARMQALEVHHRLPTPGQQTMQRYSLATDSGLPV